MAPDRESAVPDLTALDCLLQGARAVRVSDIVRPAEPAILTDSRNRLISAGCAGPWQ